jgi:hypothetical protein
MNQLDNAHYVRIEMSDQRARRGLRRAMRSMVFAIGMLAASIAAAGTSQTAIHNNAAAPQGGLQFFTDQAAFTAALGIPTNLTAETFDGGAPVGPFPTLCNEPMGSTSNDVCFTPGQLAPGFAITSTSGAGIIIFPTGFLGSAQTSRTVGATTFADTTFVTFTPAINAASADVYSGLGVNPVDIEIFDGLGASLGTTTVTPTSTRDHAVFFGVISPGAIGKIAFNAQNNGGELIDNLQFRAAGALPPGVAKSFSPAQIPAGATTTLTITLGNQSQPGAATLIADLTDTLPSGMLVAATPNASTTCSGGSLTALAGSGTVILGSGAHIPGSSLCTVKVDVTAANAGTYTNTIAASALQTDLGNSVASASANLQVSTGAGNTFPPAENFDEVFTPQLPTGWVSLGANVWITTTSDSDSAPIAAFAPDMPAVSDFTLDTPAFTPVAGQNVTFRHRYNLERHFDGGVLEISINGGAFADIIDAGGSFVSGAYAQSISDATDNPIGGRLAWSGDSQGFMTSIVTLPAAAIGQPTQLRFRCASDSSVAAEGQSGWWIDSIVLGVNSQPPIASVAPSSLTFAVEPDATATSTLQIANAVGSDPLTFTIESRGTTANTAKLSPYAAGRFGKAESLAGKTRSVRERATFATNGSGSHAASSRPWVPQGSLAFEVDDGSAESALGAGTSSPPTEQGAVYINRYSASDALVIHSISVFWPSGNGDLTGLQANLVVYYDADADGDPTNAVRVGTDHLVPISVTGNFQTYQTDFAIPAAGDVYIGFVDQWALTGGFTPRLFPAAIDESASQGKSYISSASTPPADIVHLGNNDINGTIVDVEQGSLDGNWMIRATATGGGGGGPCSGPIVNWLTATPSTDLVNGGSNTTVTVTANPSAAGLAAGVYTAQVCIITNDPARSLIAVPVSMTVGTPPPSACSGGADELFCDGFDHAQGNASIISGTINQTVAASADGSSFDFATGDYHGYDASISGDDINLYELTGGAPDGDGMYVYWYGDAVPPAFTQLVGGVVDAGGVAYAVLHSGDTVGPASMLSGASTLMANWIGGADGYVGVAFYNESTGAVNYGYLHLTTASPLGFPAQVHEWAYDNSGAAITIP